MGTFCACAARRRHEHVASRDDAATALDEDLVGRQVDGEVLADGHFDLEVLARFLAKSGES